MLCKPIKPVRHAQTKVSLSLQDGLQNKAKLDGDRPQRSMRGQLVICFRSEPNRIKVFKASTPLFDANLLAKQMRS